MAGGETLYGGQAVIEGVMMRGPAHFAVACRRESGEIALTCEPVPKVLRPSWQKFPFLRGAFALVDAMALGTRALFWAAKIAEADVEKPDAKGAIRKAEETVGPALGTAAAGQDPVPADAPPPRAPSRVMDTAVQGALVMGLLMFVGLFKLAPHLVIEMIKRAGVSSNVLLGLCDFGVRFVLFIGYITLVARQRYVYRVFQYHGAEHKAINALEATGRPAFRNGPDAEVQAAAWSASRLHPRCGTSFVVIVLFLSVLAVSPFYGLPLWGRLLVQLAMVLPVAGVSFELLRLAGKYRANPIAAALSRPGMWTQLLTTREPDKTQVAVAIASLRAVMDAEDADGTTIAGATAPTVA
jgi:uncharacterized protein YqhQ